MEKTKKLGVFTCLLMAIGTVIGAGIFGSIPEAAAIVGPGLLWAYFLAFLTIIFRFMPTIVTSSVLPSPFCSYMHATRLVSPALGFSQVIFGFNFVFLLASLSTVFAQYFSTYVPIDKRILGVLAIILFLVITCFGAKVNAAVQNVMVALLVVALLIFIVHGFPNINPEYLSFKNAILPPGLTLTSIGAAVGIVSGTLQGGHNVMNYADEVENPGKAIPIAFVGSGIICTILFMLVGAVTLGLQPVGELTTLKDSAALFMSTPELHFFIIGGAIIAVLTSMNGMFLSASRMIAATAADKVMPSWFDKRNHYGVAQNSVIFLGVIAALIVAFNIPIGVLLGTFSLLTLVCNLVLFIPAMKIHKLYPNSYKHAYLKFTPPIVIGMSIIGIIVSIWQIWSLVANLSMPVTIALICWVGGWYVFFFVRRAYLKKHGVDLDESLSSPYPEWTIREKELAEK